jgi:hypothetical protein
MRARNVVGIVVGLVLTLATASGQAAQPLSPLVGNWDQYFRVDASPTARDGRAVVSGNVWNISDWRADRIQLLVEGLDATGQPVTQRVVWLGSDLSAGMHAFFEVPVPAAASYRVSVFAFDSSRSRC